MPHDVQVDNHTVDCGDLGALGKGRFDPKTGVEPPYFFAGTPGHASMISVKQLDETRNKDERADAAILIADLKHCPDFAGSRI